MESLVSENCEISGKKKKPVGKDFCEEVTIMNDIAQKQPCLVSYPEVHFVWLKFPFLFGFTLSEERTLVKCLSVSSSWHTVVLK